MRLVSILSALIVALLLYGFVMERDTLRAIAGADSEAVAGETETRAAEPSEEAVSVVALRSQAREIESGVVLRGRTEAARRVQVRAEVSGLVISEPLRRGARVARGDLLCEIDPGTRPSALAEAEARLLEAEANQKASERLAERGFTAETTAIGNRAALQAARALVAQARREIGQLELIAPFDGLLESDTAEIGSLLQPGSECATIIDLDPIKFVGFVPENTVDKIETGAAVRARLLTGQQVAGTVSFVSRSADPETRTFRVEAETANPDLRMRDGISAEIVVALEGTQAHLVPQSTLTLDDAGDLGVRAVVDGTARFMPVVVVRDTVEGVWVTGLPGRVDIIVLGQDFVTNGEPVRASYRESAP